MRFRPGASSTSARHAATLLLLCSLLIVLLCLGAFLAWRGQSARWDQALAAESAVNLAGQIGVNLETAELLGPAAALDQTLARLDQAGIGWVRFTLPWDQVEPARGQFAFGPWDTVFATLAAHPGLHPLVTLDRSPAWARAAADAANPAAPPHERADFGAFAAAVARRYGGQLRYYQVWHEPNIAPHWGARPANPADYLGLLREGAVQLRAADTDARIVLAALAPTIESGGQNQSDLSYLDALYRLGGRAWFDVVAAQPYGFSEPPAAAPDVAALNFGRAALLRGVMARHGDADTPIWGTSFGWNALVGRTTPWGQVTEEAQARYATEALALTTTRWPWLGPLFWAANCPPRPVDDSWLGFALCAADGSARPVLGALTAAARQPSFLPPGEHLPGHPALRYSLGWRTTPAAADPGADGDTLTFDFYGAGLALRFQGGPYWAYLRVTIDGQPANALPRDEAGRAYLVLHDPLNEERVAPVAQGLPVGRHQAQIEAVGGWGQWPLRGIIVSPETRRSLSLAVWAGLIALASLAWLMLVWRWLPAAARWLLARRDDLASLPEPVIWSLAIGLGLCLAFGHWFPLDLAALTGLGVLFLARSDSALPLIAAAIPFWQQPKVMPVGQFSLYELLIWVAVAARAGDWGLQAVCAAGWGIGAASRSMNAGRSVPSTRPDGQSGQALSEAARSDGSVLRLRPAHFGGTLHGVLPRGFLDAAILVLLFSGVLSTLVAERYGVALREFRTVFLTGALFYWLITRLPSGPRLSQRASGEESLIAGLLAGAVAASLIGLAQLASGQGRVDVEGVWRVRALYGSPNNLALLLVRIVPLAVALAAFARSRRALRSVALWAVALITAAACLATFSKGGLLLGLPVGLGIVLLGGAWRTRRRWPLLLLALLAAAGFAAVLVLLRTPRFADLLNLESGTTFFRIKLWQAAWQMTLDHLWLGVGPDNFLYAYRTHYVLPSAWQELNLSHPHNILLDLWTRLGLIGVAAGGWALIASLRRGWQLFRGGDDRTWPLALGLLAGLAATVAHGLIDNSLFLVDLMALFMLAAGLLRRLTTR